MTGKIFTGFVVGFWLVMMTALVRVEFFPKALHREMVSTTRVLQKVFANPEPARLNVYYQGTLIGFCKVEIDPQLSLTDTTAVPAGKRPGAYVVKPDVTLNLLVFGTPSRFVLKGESKFNNRFDVQQFNVKTSFGESHMDIKGDPASKKVQMTLDTGGSHEQRELSYAELQGPGLLTALGLPALPGLGGLGLLSGVMPGAAPGNTPALKSVTQIYRDSMSVGGLTQPAFLIESKINEGIWGKIWVDESGEILLVETSMGLTMRSDLIDSLENNQAALTPVRSRLPVR
jgi:hypothetical protein